MTRYEYKVVPAPTRGVKAKTARNPEDRFAHALTEVMNTLGAEGWEYVRCDTLPSDERTGLTGRTTVYRNLLVFRRPVAEPEADTLPATDTERSESFAARVAATLRPGAAAQARAIPAAAVLPAAIPPGSTRAPGAPSHPGPARPIGPAERGAPGDAPRLRTDDQHPDGPHPDGPLASDLRHDGR